MVFSVQLSRYLCNIFSDTEILAIEVMSYFEWFSWLYC